MKTITFSLVFASIIAIYTTTDSKSEHLVKISFIVPELKDLDTKLELGQKINSLDGIKRNNSDVETGSVELVVDYSEFSIDDLKTSFDKSGWSYENASIEDVY
mgnify:FL=1|tara:strand:- start:1635 stop:1943 length:309 start_codon:yes stop_codon:yes gene_type:complete